MGDLVKMATDGLGFTGDDPKSAADIRRKAAKQAEAKRLSSASSRSAKGKTKYASAPAFGMANLKTKVGQ